jgi:hypothetical protein
MHAQSRNPKPLVAALGWLMYSDSQVQSCTGLAYITPGDTHSICSGLFIIIVIAIYTAGTAARLTAAQLTGGIRGRDDLKGRAVGTW